MPDYEIEVDVVPEGTGFPAQLAAVISKAEAGADPVEVDLEPKVDGRRFDREARAQLKKAVRDLDAEVQLHGTLARNFRRDLQREIRTQVAALSVPVTGELSRNFARDLRRELRTLGASSDFEVPLSPRLGRSFRADLQKAITASTAGNPVEVPVQGKPGPRFRANLQAAISEALAARPLTADVSLQLSKRALPSLAAEVQKATTELSASGAADVEVGIDATKARTQMAALGSTLGDGDVGKRAGSNLGRNILIGLGLGLAGIGVVLAGAFAVAVNSAADFTAELSNLQAVAGTTREEMAELRQQALDLGASTVFSATEAAQAQTELAKAGASVEQILSGGLTAALDLAAAGEIELADAATYVATGLNTFQLAAEDAGRVADVLSAAANRSATDIPNMGLALSQVGLVANGFGISIEETAGSLALFAQNGLTGSDAGTSFKTMLQRLNPQSEEAATLMSDLGLAFYDSEGAFVGLESVAEQLQQKLGGLTEEQRNAALATLFGTDAVRAANLLYSAGGEGIAEWTAAVDDSGNAAETARIKLDNLKGDLEGLKGAFETVFITAGEGQMTGLRDLVQSLTGVVTEAGPALVNALAPVGELIADLTPGIGRLVTSLSPLLTGFGELAGPIAGAALGFLSELFTVVGDLLGELTPLARVVGSVLDAFAPLLPVLADVARTVLLALVPGFEALGDDRVVGAVGDLAEAFGEMLVALAPLLPVLVGVGAELAEQMLPILQALVPVIDAVVSVLGPLLEDLAGLAPLVLLAVGIAKLVGLVQNVTAALGKLRDQVVGVRDSMSQAFGGRGQALFTGLTSAAAAAAGAVSGYMLGMADDATSAVLSIGSVATSVFLGFQQGGPVGAALAIASAAVGVFFGQMQKEQRAAIEEQRLLAAETRALSDAFDSAGVDSYSSSQAKALVVTRHLLDTLKETSDEGDLARAAFRDLGLSVEDVAIASTSGERGLRDLRDELDKASASEAAELLSEVAGGARDVGVFSEEAQDAVDRFASSWGDAAVAAAGATTASTTALENLRTDFSAGEITLREYVDGLAAATGATLDYDNANAALLRSLQTEIRDSPVARFIEGLPESTREAIAEQQALSEVQRLVAREQERQRGGAVRYAEAYDEVAGSVDAATDAYDRWLDSQTGGAVDLAEVRLGVLDFARSMRDLATDPELSPFERTQEELLLVADAQRQVGDAVSTFIAESNGDYDVFLGKVQGLESELTAGLVETLGISTEEAAGLVDQILQIPPETTFSVLADTAQAVTGLDDVQNRVLTYINSNINNRVLLDAADPVTDMGIVQTLLANYAASDPQAKAFLDTLNVQEQAAFAESLLAELDSRRVTSNLDIIVGVGMDPKVEQATGDRYIAAAMAAWAKENGFARGGLISAPQLALVGEAGPELILPLDDRDRMVELLRMAGVVGATADPLAVAPVAAPAPSGAPADPVTQWAPGTEGVSAWVDSVIELMAGAGVRLTEEALPTWLSWEQAVEELFARLGLTSEQTAAAVVALASATGTRLLAITTDTGSRAVAAITIASSQMLTALDRGMALLEARAAAGGRGIVAGLSSALTAGTETVEGIVIGYRGTLVGALNPVLSAVGSQPIRLALGGHVPGPDVRQDIVPALLMPGEYVLTRGMVEQAGLANLEAWRRSSLRGYAEGGMVVGDTDGLNSEYQRRLGAWATSLGEPYNVRSGFRSFQEQQQLYAAYLAGVGNLAAPPGASMHNFGLATDGPHWRRRNPEKFGITFPIGPEPWHAEPFEAKQWAAGMNPDSGAGLWGAPLPQPPDAGARGYLSDVAAALMEHAYQQALTWASDISYASPGDISAAGSGSAREALARLWIAEAIRLAGVPASWGPGLLTIARRESGLDPRAINLWDSNAAKGQASRGLMQVIPSTFAAYHLPGLTDIWNPVHNVVAAIRYILARYDDIANVQQANPNLPPKGYRDGGMVLGDGRRIDTASLSAAIRQQGGIGGTPTGGSSSGRSLTIENMNLSVAPPTAADPENYGQALQHRAVPLMSAVLARLG